MGTGLEGSLHRNAEAAKVVRCQQCGLITEHTLGTIEKGTGKVKEVYTTKTCTKCGTTQEVYLRSQL